jgi:hypothetical protein
VTLYYSGGNSVTSVWSSEEPEEYIGCYQVGAWSECPDLTVRRIDTGVDATYSLEIGSVASEEFWIVAMPSEDAPFECDD